jgi:hypothetical protein
MRCDEQADGKFDGEDQAVGGGGSILVAWFPRDLWSCVNDWLWISLLEILFDLKALQVRPSRSFLVVNDRE